MKFTPEKEKRKNWATVAMLFVFLFSTTNIAAFVLVFGLKFVVMKNFSDFAPVNIFMGIKVRPIWEITEFPFPYLSSISFFLALVGTCWISFVAPKLKRFLQLQLLFIPWITVFLTSPFWGLIWAMSEKPPASFSSTSMMITFYKYHAAQALDLGWVSAMFSFPTNILSYLIAYLLLIIANRLYLHFGTNSTQPVSIGHQTNSA